jgi:hypothetical protein
MSKRLDPEIKAMRAVVRAMSPLDSAAEKRTLEWYVAHRANRTWVTLPNFRARAGECADGR